MENHDSVAILGGTRPHAELAKYLRYKGFRTVLIDFFLNPVAKEYVDVHYQESSLDVEAVEKICCQEKVKYIMDVCTDRAIPPAAYVAELLGLSHPITYNTSLVVTNKNKMKSMMKSAGVPTSDFMMVESIEELKNIRLNYPLIIKPSDASGSIGITKIFKEEELEKATRKALSFSNNNQAIVEEFVTGSEIQIDCFVSDGISIVLDIKEKRKYTEDILTLSYGSLIPARISKGIENRCHEISQKIANCLRIQNGPLYIQAIATGEEVFVIEFGLRFGGNLSYQIIHDITGVDIISATAEAYLGNKPEIKIKAPELPVYATYHVFPVSGTFSKVIGIDELQADGFVNSFKQNRPFGIVCLGDMSSSERIASFTVRANSYEENDKKLKYILSKIDVLNEMGESIMRKDIYEIKQNETSSV